MKNRVLFGGILLLLSLAMLMPFLASCTDRAGETEKEREAEKVMRMAENGKPLYTIEADKNVFRKCEEAIYALTATYESCFGTQLEFDGTAERKIRLLRDAEEERSWSIRVLPDTFDIEIHAGDYDYLSQAILRFVSIAFSGAEKDPAVSTDWNCEYSYEKDAIDNSSLLEYLPATKENCLPAGEGSDLLSPDWLDRAVIVELMIDTASNGKTFAESYDLLDFYAATGVNCLWITPVYQRGPGGNGYGNCGPHTLEPSLFRAKTEEGRWQELHDFIGYAHSKGIYILLDVISWGAMKNTELPLNHKDWFAGEAWGNEAFNWENKEFAEWYVSVCVEDIMKTDADGFRCDCEPNYAGYEVFGEIRDRLADKGKYIVLMSEDGCSHMDAYDLEQDGVIDYRYYDRATFFFEAKVNFFAEGKLDVVSSSKQGIGLGSTAMQEDAGKCGTAKYYTNAICNHDFRYRIVHGDRLNIGYAAIFAPYIPLWYMGEEFDATDPNTTLYLTPVDYAEAGKDKNRVFAEDVRQMLRIRRSYPDLFEYWPVNHRDSNICEVKTENFGELTAYARYSEERAVLIIPNEKKAGGCIGKIEIPFEECGLSGERFKITDILSGRVLREGNKEELASFEAAIPHRYMGVFLVEKA